MKEYEKACGQIAELKRLKSIARDRGEAPGNIAWLIPKFKRKLNNAIPSHLDKSFSCIE